jgi:hypothetical protein
MADNDAGPPPDSFRNPYPTAPYPDEGWRLIENFHFDTDLVLTRKIQAVRRRAGEDADYVVGADYKIRFDLQGTPHEIVVPRGLITDLASVPRLLRSVFGRVGPHLEGSIVHDFLYVAWQDLDTPPDPEQGRRFADDVFWHAMIAAKVERDDADTIYWAVRGAGEGAYTGRDHPRYVPL